MYKYGEFLKEQRIMRGLTLKDVEKATGIHNASISRWERDEVLPNIDFCVQLANFYGITLDELVGRDAFGSTDKRTTTITNSFNGAKIDGGVKF